MQKTTRDNLLYLTIALGFVGILLVTFWYEDAHGLPIRVPVSDAQFAFVATTAIVFGTMVYAWRNRWRNGRFWAALCLMIVGYAPLQWQLVVRLKMRALPLILVAVLELFVLSATMSKLVPRGK